MDGRPNYQSAMRIEKLDTLFLIVEKCSNAGLPAIKHELFVFCTERWGSQWRKFMEYLNDLVMRKMIVVDGEEVWTYRRWKKIEEARRKSYPGAKEFVSIADEVSKISSEDRELAKQIVEKAGPNYMKEVKDNLNIRIKKGEFNK